MELENKYFLFLSDLLGLKVLRANRGKTIGKVVEVAVTAKEIYPVVSRLIISQGWFRPKLTIAWNEVLPFELPVRKLLVREDYQPDRFQPLENELLLKEGFLDKQIVDISGCKVVRVNDLHLLKENNKILLVHMEVGFRGILKRLGVSKQVATLLAWLFSYQLHDKFVSWKYVQRLAGDGAHYGYLGLQLKSASHRLSDLHPADLAEILLDLKRPERIAFLRSLDPRSAAETLSELKPDSQRILLDGLDKERRLQVINELLPDKMADLLSHLHPERREDILKSLSPVKVAEVNLLLKHPEATAGALMTTKFIALGRDLSAEEALVKIRECAPQISAIYYTYVVDEVQALLGVITLRHLLAAPATAKLSEIMNTRLVKIKETAPERKVTRLFIKYNFGALPVVDNQNKLKGIILFKDAVDKVLSALAEPR